MLNIGPQEVLLILIIALVVVGPQRLPELSRAIGKALRTLRSAQDEMRRSVADVIEPEAFRDATKDLRRTGKEVRESLRLDAPAVRPVVPKPEEKAPEAPIGAEPAEPEDGPVSK